jgi:two-component system, NtrC family, response regulator AtoC
MDSGKARVLFVANDAPKSLVSLLSTCGAQVTAVKPPEAPARLEASLFDLSLVLLDSPSTSLALVGQLHEGCADTPVIAVGPDEPELMHQALAAGAIEYLSWPSTAESVSQLLKHALKRALALTPTSAPPATESGLLGSSPQLTAARETLARVAAGVATVLVRGETGTGKELAARAIHTQSPRRDGPFIKVHTPAVPDSLLESELFGYEKGAFTGAAARKPGRVELAEGGTLFLDEIGEISPVMQAKLLRLLQDREFERLGGTRTLRADIRVVAATHRDLEHLVDSGEFREDLFYRLNVVTIWLPPLRARREDISHIAEHYLERFCRANHKQLRLDAGALQALQAERWPGNVRQLVNLIERLVVLTEQEHISGADVRRELSEQQAFLTQAIPGDAGGLPQISALPAQAVPADSSPAQPQAVPPTALHFSSAVRPLKEDVRRTELRAITKALHVAKGNRALAARLLGVSRRTLYTKLDEHGIE